MELASEVNPKVSPALSDALELLKWNVSLRQVVGFSRLCALVVFLASLAIAIVFFPSNLLVSMLLIVLPAFACLHYISEYPKIAGRVVALNAIGNAPRTLVYLIIPLKQNPNLEEAFRFAGEHSEGDIATDLRETLWRVWSGNIASVKSALPGIAEKWGKHAPEFKHSLYLVISSLSEKSQGSRALTLDRALSYSLEGIVSKMQSYVAKLFVPTLLIFSFGTIVPLMFISLLPLLVYFGIKFSSPIEVAVLLGLTLLLLFVYSEKVLLERPPSFSQSRLPMVKLPLPFWATVVISTIVIGLPGILFFATEANLLSIEPTSLIGFIVYNVNSISILWGFVIGVSLYFHLQAAPLKKTRERQAQLESELVSVLHQLASRMSDKRPPEEAMAFASTSSPDSSLAKLLGEASESVKRRAITLDAALFDPTIGACRNLPSTTAETALRLFTTSCKKGSVTASQVLYSASDYFLRLQKVEEELRSLLSKNISMLRATAIIFAPVVTAVVVVMFRLISSSVSNAQEQLTSLGYGGGQAFSSALLIQVPSFSTPSLLLVVGLYMIGLCLVTMRYASFVENGPDEVTYKLETAMALPLSMAVFTIVLIIAGSFLVA